MSRHMRTTVRLNDALLSQAKREAARRGTTLTSLMEQGLHLALAERRAKIRKPVELPVWNSGGVRQGIDISNSAGLLNIMENRPKRRH